MLYRSCSSTARSSRSLSEHCLVAVLALAAAAPLVAADWADPAAIRADIEILAADDCQGRGTGTPGIARAEAHIAKAMAAAGLSPLGENGGWFQSFEVVTGVKIEPGTALTGPDGEKLVPGREFAPLTLSGSGTVAATAIVFAGYGITAPELHHDDYAGVDVKGKLVLVLAHDPRELDQKSPFRAPAAFRYTEVRYKTLNARQHGAAGILIANDAWRHSKDADTPIAFDGGHAVSPAGIPAASITQATADRFLAPLGKTAAALGRELDKSLGSASRVVPGARAGAAVRLSETRGQASNVLGILRGSDPKLAREAVVIGAHHDHLGLGGVYSLSPTAKAIHHGADDNASGVAGVLALARRFASRSPRPPRSIVFATFSAEELGLLGSAHYVKNAAFPLDRTVAMLNMDMIGRMRDRKLTVQGVETAVEFRGLIENAAKGSGLAVATTGDGYGPSDQTSFYAKDRPVLFFFTGPHTDYHRPTDTADKVDAAGEASVLRVIAAIADRLTAGAPPTFVKAKSPPPGHGVAGKNTGRGYGPYFGSIPDFSEYKGGVLLSGVRPGSPAEKAGLKGGDAIVHFGGVTVANLQDFTFALQTHRPGDAVDVTVLREKKRLQMKAVLEKRK